ncbi:MAG: response regulator [Candidatus Krumholzibacteriota bacterium]|nr:response regulator [Candidatus Krumholzibacteriota bacterium]
MIKVTAMVVDDSKVMRNLVKQTLKKTGLAEFEFQEAEDGEEALEKFDETITDIVFADWNMPRMSGIALAKEIRNNEKNRRVPIIMVTSEKAMGKVEQALDEVGANAYVTKPFTPDEMKQKIEKIIASLGNKKQQKSDKSGGFFKNLVS